MSKIFGRNHVHLTKDFGSNSVMKLGYLKPKFSVRISLLRQNGLYGNPYLHMSTSSKSD